MSESRIRKYHKEVDKETGQQLITIGKDEFDALWKDRDWLWALEAAGVDNWDGCSYAYDMMNEEDDTTTDE